MTALNEPTGSRLRATPLAFAGTRNTPTPPASRWPPLVRAVQQGLVTEKEIDAALYHTLWTRFRLGLFDPAGQDPYSQYTLKDNDTPEHQEVALALARQLSSIFRALAPCNCPEEMGVVNLKNNLLFL